MKKMLLALTVIASFNFAQADENPPVNFHRDTRFGQFNMKFKLNQGGDVSEFEQKICVITPGRGDGGANGKFDIGCRAKKLKDTLTDLEYLVTCTGKPDTNMHWMRISEDEFSFLSKSTESEIAATYKYVSAQCDADAITK